MWFDEQPAEAQVDVEKVEFQANGAVIGQADAPPYLCGWTPSAIGTVQLTAQVYDIFGGTGVSQTVSVTVAENKLPQAAWKQSLSGMVDISVLQRIGVEGSDADGEIASAAPPRICKT